MADYQDYILKELGLPQAPHALEQVILETMQEYGPDRHTDGHKIIAARAYAWKEAND